MTESLENILGLSWDFTDDTIRPHLEVFLSKKKRGIHLDEPISIENIAEAILTARIVLRVASSIYDLSGRILEPLIIKSKL